MENINDIITTVQLTLLVLAIPVVRLLLAWQNLLDAMAYREEQAGDKDHTLAIMAMVERSVLKPAEAKDLLVCDGDEDDEDDE